MLLLLGSVAPVSFKKALHITSDHRIAHTVIHTIAFAVLSFLFARAPELRSRNLPVLGATVLFGIMLEILESVVYSYPHSAEVSDMRLDAYGALVGCLAAGLIARPGLRGQ